METRYKRMYDALNALEKRMYDADWGEDYSDKITRTLQKAKESIENFAKNYLMEDDCPLQFDDALSALKGRIPEIEAAVHTYYRTRTMNDNCEMAINDIRELLSGEVMSEEE